MHVMFSDGPRRRSPSLVPRGARRRRRQRRREEQQEGGYSSSKTRGKAIQTVRDYSNSESQFIRLL